MTLLQNPKRNMLERLKEGYQYAGTTLLTALVIFLVLNLVCLAIIRFKKTYFPFSRLTPDAILYLEPLYPKLDRKQILDLWRESVLRRFSYDPYTQFKSAPLKTKYVHIDPNGFRHVKHQAPWPPTEEPFTIFVFGGSTAFGWGVPDEETIASHLQDMLQSGIPNQKSSVYNFGQGAFFSTQERIFFEQLIVSGHKPDMAIFIDGINECALEEPLYSQELRDLFDGKPRLLLKQLPAMRIGQKIRELFERFRPSPPKAPPTAQNARRFVERYLSNKTMTTAIADAYGIKTVFIWQPAPLYRYDHRHNIFLGEKELDDEQFFYEQTVYEMMEPLARGQKLGKNFLWLADMQQNLKKPLYVDQIHYSPEMSQKIASEIYDFIKPSMKPQQNGPELPLST